ncbi:MAG: adenosylmethionine--8-amino-7-oxononanoate transaminase [Planctomycetes bacterium]|nr:adenosylmethionine--8-amino-7-oxononanoate transaminase [Planctomycetota bacterium]
MKRPGVMILGTDTGVGKTRVAASLVRALRRRGVEAVPWKPYATGVERDRVTPGEDADLLLRAAGFGPERLADVSTVRLRRPLAPALAAGFGDEGDVPSPADVLRRAPAGALLVAEGCGGLLVPLTAACDQREFCFDLGLPVVIVARPHLGTINHTRLTIEAARAGGLDVLGVVVCGFPEDTADEATRLGPSAIRDFTDAGLLGVVPLIARPDDVDALADAVDASIDVDALLRAMRAHAASARGAQLADADRRHVWHPFTQMRDWQAREPVVIERAKGPWLFDTDGNAFIDGVSSLWTNVHGHRVPEIDTAIRAQLGRVAHTTLLGLASVPSIECAEELLRVAPRNLSRVFYSDSGSTAAEVALKMAFQRAKQIGEPQRRLFVRFEGAYHGDTLGAVSVGGIDLFHQVFGSLLFETIQLPAPYAYRRPAGVSESEFAEASVAALERTMRERGDEIAAVVVEPVMQGAAGMIPQPPGWLPRVAAATRAAGVLLICDEVATGFGRTGRMFAVEHEGVAPDLLCVAKGLTGGYLPLAATLATESVHDAFLGEPHEGKTFFHGHTYTGNPLACAAAVANLRLMADRGTVAEAARAGDRLGALLDAAFRDHPHVGDVRRRGLMTGIELVRNRATKAPFDARDRIGWRVCAAAMERGLRIRPLGDVIVLMPPLTIGDDLLARIVEILAKSIHDVLPETARP